LDTKKYISFRTKILMLVLIGILIPTACILTGTFLIIYQVTGDAKVQADQEAMSAARERLKQIVQSVGTSVKAFYNEKMGAMPEDEILISIQNQIRTSHYGKSGSFFIYQYDGSCLVNSDDPSEEGQNLWDLGDQKGQKFVRKYIKAAQRGGDVVTFVGQDPEAHKTENKLSYIMPIRLGNLELAIGTATSLPYFKTNTADGARPFEKICRMLVETVITCILVIILIIFYIYHWFVKSIANPVDNLLQMIKNMADGNFSFSIPVRIHNELGEMSLELEKMGHGLSNLLGQLLGMASRVSSASKEIASGNQDLSKCIQEQAVTLEQIAFTIEEVNSSVIQALINFDQAQEFSRTALDTVTAGEKSIRETHAAMQQISAGSRQIVEIINAVNDIAFQINLLALNAAVEAARVGEQGRGFAVVAAEVRKLARRVADSSKEIGQLIKEEVERVDRGSSLVGQSVEILQQIVINTNRTSDGIGEAAATMKEQTGSTQQIQSSVEQLNQVAQQNAEIVGKMATASLHLNREATTLNEWVSNFRANKIDSKISKPFVKPTSVLKNTNKLKQVKDNNLIEDEWEKF
jgi:methyl-accepting chemotaxis protein